MEAKCLRPMKVTSEVLTESGDRGTRPVLFLSGPLSW